MAERVKPDCQTCGACCWSPHDQEVWCDITTKEASSFSPQFRVRNVKAAALRTKWLMSKAGPFKEIEACVCCQLDGSLMHRVRCRIYPERPRICRTAVRPGDKVCREARRQLLMGDGVQLRQEGQVG